MKEKRASPPTHKHLRKTDSFLLQTMKFMLKRAKICLKGNKKRRTDTFLCIKFCVLIWCGRRELNPYGKTTRPSNVRVCQFRHSRRTVGIIS